MWTMRYFHFSSLALLLFLTLSCSPVSRSGYRRVHKTSPDGISWHSPFLSNDFQKALFKARFRIGSHDLSGLVLIKRTADSTLHFYFASEFGMTFFDLRSTPQQTEVQYIFEPMNRKSLLRILGNDLRLLFFAPDPSGKAEKIYRKDDPAGILVKSGKHWFASSDSAGRLGMLYSGSNFMTRCSIGFSRWEDAFPATIRIRNSGIGLSMDLELIRLN